LGKLPAWEEHLFGANVSNSRVDLQQNLAISQTAKLAGVFMSSLQGARVLVVEDEAMLSLILEDMLVDLGCVVAGTAAKLDGALEMARTSEYDVALLDVNLGGKRVDPVAEAVRARGTPVIFVTGYGKAGASGLVLEKPYDAAGLERTLNQALGTGRG
jgi:CheY-like chemotaxis protein